MLYPPERKPEFGKLLAAYRGDLGWSQSELARQMTRRGYPISASAINKYELGERRPDATFVYHFTTCYKRVCNITPRDASLIAQGLIRALALDYQADLFAEFKAARAKGP